jgi:uncharacterized small protein (DUF1192 family)
MSRTRSDRPLRLALGILAATFAATAPAHAQEAARLLSSEITISRGEAVLNLELSDGRELTYAVRDGNAVVNGDVLGSAARGGALDRAWRELLGQAMEARTADLPALLTAWDAPGGSDVAAALDRSLESALADVSARADAQATLDPGAPLAPAAPGALDDSVSRLNERIAELQAELESADAQVFERTYMRDRNRGFAARTFGRIGRSIAGIVSLLVTYAVLFGIGFATIVLGGRRFIEGVGDTARHATVRSGLVGLAATFLIVPAFVLGIIALVISIVGIPALLVFVPLYPIAVVVAALLGYLGVAHAFGEAFAERRYSGEEWYRRGNSYYFLLAGLALLLALFLGTQILQLTPFLDWLGVLLTVLGCAITVIVMVIGFGAVLISRGGTRPVVASGIDQSEMFTEESHV